MTKLFTFLLLFASCYGAQADCPATLRLQGMMNIEQCNPGSTDCVRSEEALYENMKAKPDDGPEVLSIATHGSPWHLYDADYRILEIEELVAMVRQQGSNIKRVKLIASWSGTSPDPHSQSVAQKLSTALGGMPVTGQDGFVWISPKGTVRTTRQAFTARIKGPYWVGKHKEVMASLVSGWVIDLEEQFLKERNGAGLSRVAAAKDIFMLCPDGALKSYDEAAALNDPVAGFNAAIMRIARNTPGDAAAAMVLLKQAAAQGDAKAGKKLESLARTTPAR